MDRATLLSYNNLRGQSRDCLVGMLAYLDNSLARKKISQVQYDSPAAAIRILLTESVV